MGSKFAAGSLTGNVTTATVIAEHPGGNTMGSRAIVLTTSVGASPTVTLNIQGSADGNTWFNIPYALPATPTTFVTTAITITTADTFIYLLSDPVQPTPYAYVRLALTANNNVTVLQHQMFQ